MRDIVKKPNSITEGNKTGLMKDQGMIFVNSYYFNQFYYFEKAKITCDLMRM